MDERGLWRLFWKTGLPEAYLAFRAAREEREALFDQPAKTAFGEVPDWVRQI